MRSIDRCSNGMVLLCIMLTAFIVLPTVAACLSGTWGKDCQRDCNCRDSDTVCNVTTGCEECPTGFSGGDCHDDINECDGEDSPCDEHANCTNTVGTFKCSCHVGYTQFNATVCQGTVMPTIIWLITLDRNTQMNSTSNNITDIDDSIIIAILIICCTIKTTKVMLGNDINHSLTHGHTHS